MERRKISSIAIELTANCNQKCDYCYNEWREDGGKAAHGGCSSDEQRQRALERVDLLLRTLDFERATLTGGEPLSRPEFFEVARRLSGANVTVQVISNGTLITEAIAQRMKAVPIASVQITLNGPDAALHEAHVGKGFYERTLRGVRHLLDAGVTVVGCIVVTKKNAAVVDRILCTWRDLGVDTVALSRFSPAGYAARHAAHLLPSVPELTRAFELANPFGETMTLQCTMPVPPCAVELERFPNIRFGTCPVGTASQEFALGPSGALRHCTLHGEALDGVPDILQAGSNLARLIDSPQVKQYRATRPDFCAGCQHEHSCGGGCGAASQWVFGTRRLPDPLVHQHVDSQFNESLAFSRRAGKTHLELIL